MKVLFAVSNEEISEAIVKKYQKEYKEIISYKNVYYFNAILKEIQKDKTYDRIVISEELEAFTNTQYDQIDKFIFEKLDSISDEAANSRGDSTPIILICSDRRTKGEEMLVKLFGIGIYDALIGNDRSVEEVCRLIHTSRSKKEAKLYYKVESEQVKYQSENENDVSEQEIQNILAHYKKLGKNEDKYVASFNNIVEQYNDAQLRIISKFLPLNVRAVLEEKSSKYQQIMSFNNAVTDSIRKPEKSRDLGPSGKLLRPKNAEVTLTGPVVIPSSVNTNNVKKLSRTPSYEDDDIFSSEPEEKEEVQVLDTNEFEDVLFENTEMPKRRGRPRKVETNIDIDNEIPEQPKRRGRPRKNPVVEEDLFVDDDEILPGFENVQNISSQMQEQPEFEPEPVQEPAQEPEQEIEESILPGFENVVENEKYDYADEPILPGFETVNQDYEQSRLTQKVEKYNQTKNNNYEIQESTYTEPVIPQRQDFQYQNNNNYYEPSMASSELSSLLTGNKKVVTFVGTSKNGTSFIVNNLAEYASSMGINVAILDTTVNKNSYYIYTKNEEELRKIASECLENLISGQAKGIGVNRNLTVYTSLPEDRENLNNVNQILETIVRRHDLVLIDCDFNTPYDYFYNAQEIYLVQSLDILTIQPLTAFLRELKAKNVLDSNKLKIILNKYVKVRGISEKTIIGGMSKYNDPAMSFMTDLFDMNTVKYITIPFEQDIYARYLESVINCDVSIKGYSKGFMQILKELNNWVYPMVPGNNAYRPPVAPTYNNSTFSPSMNNTLNQMKRKF